MIEIKRDNPVHAPYFTIIQDTREKQPWIFSQGQMVQKLDAGDYALMNSFLIIIERKKRVSELSNNLGMKRIQFENELSKMCYYKYKYVVCEFTYEDMLKYPRGEKIPRKFKRRIKMNGKYMAKIIRQLEEAYDVEFIFCENRQEAQQTAKELMENAARSAT